MVLIEFLNICGVMDNKCLRHSRRDRVVEVYISSNVILKGFFHDILYTTELFYDNGFSKCETFHE